MTIRGLNNESPKRALPSLRRGRRVGKKKTPYQLKMEPLEKRELPAVQINFTNPAPLTYLPAAQSVTFEFTVSASSDYTGGTHLTIRDVLDANTPYVANSATFQPLPTGLTLSVSSNGRTIEFDQLNSSTFASGTVVTFDIVASLAANVADGTTLTNQVTIFSGGPDTAGASLQDLAANADLQITTQSPINYVPGQNLTYTVTLSNVGHLAANNVTFTESLNPSASAPTTVDPANSTSTNFALFGTPTAFDFTLTAGSFAANDQVVVTISESLNGSLTLGLTDHYALSSPTNNQLTVGSVLLTPNVTTDLVVTTVASAQGSGYAGTEVTYFIQVQNTGPSNAIDVTLVDTFDSGFSFDTLASQLPSGWTSTPFAGGVTLVSPGPGTYSLANGDFSTFTIVESVGPAVPSGMYHSTFVPSDLSGIDSTTTPLTLDLSITPQADLQITTISPATLVAGGQATFDVRVANTGPDSITSPVTLVESLSGAVLSSPLSGTSGWVLTSGGNLFTLISATGLASGVTVDVTLEGAIPSNQTGPNVTISATVSDDTTSSGFFDPVTLNNAATKSFTLANQPNLSISVVSSTPSTLHSGTTLTYVVQLQNTGLSDDHGVTFTDNLTVNSAGAHVASGVTFVDSLVTLGGGSFSSSGFDSTNSIVTFTSADFTAGATALFTLVEVIENTTVSPSLTATLQNALTASGVSAATSHLTASQLIDPSADLQITTIVATPDPVIAGTTLAYDIHVVNKGNDTAQNLTIVESLDSSTSYSNYTVLSASNAWQIAGSSPTGLVTLTAASLLASSTTIDVTLDAVVAASTPNGSTLTDQATIFSATFDPDSTNNTATVSVQVTTAPALAITKTILPSANPLQRSGDLTYLITITNDGPSNETATITVTDLFDANATYMNGSVLGLGSTWGLSGAFNPTLDVFTLAPTALTVGAAVSFEVVASVGATVTGGTVLTNTATVSSIDDPTPSVASAVTTVVTTADLSVSYGPNAPVTAVAGQNLTYDVVVTNNDTIDSVKGITLTETLDSRTSFGSLIGPVGATTLSISSSVVEFIDTVDTISAGSSLSFAFTVSVSPTAAGTSLMSSLATSVTISGANAVDSVASNNSAALLSPVISQTDLVISKTGPSTAFASEGTTFVSLVTYTIMVSNNGPSEEEGSITVTDNFDPTLSYAVGSASGGWTESMVSAGVEAFTAPAGLSLDPTGPNQTTTFTIVATVESFADGGTSLVNSVSVNSADIVPNNAHNNSSWTLGVLFSADLAITQITPTPNPVIAGTTLAYDIQVLNNGRDPASNLTIVESLDPATTYSGYTVSSASGHWSIAGFAGNLVTLVDSMDSLTLGQSIDVTLDAVVSSSTSQTLTQLVDRASISAAITDNNPNNNTASCTVGLSYSADLSLGLTATPNPVTAGTTLQYDLQVTDIGPSDAVGLTIVETLDANTSYGSPVVLTPGWQTIGFAGNLLTLTAANLVAGTSIDVTVDVSVAASTALSITALSASAAVTSSTHDPDSSNNTASVTTNLVHVAALSITKTNSPATTAVAGSVITYSITVTNSGPSDAFSVTLTDMLSPSLAGLAFFNATSTAGSFTLASSASEDLTYTSSEFASGATVTFTVELTVPSNVLAGTVLTETAIVTAVDDSLTHTATVSNTVTATADFAITKLGQGAVTAGTLMDYTLQVVNSGPSDARNVTLVDALPTLSTGREYLASLPSLAGWSVLSAVGDTTLTLVSSDVTPGEADFTFAVSVASSVTQGSVLVNGPPGLSLTTTTSLATATTANSVSTSVDAVADLSVTQSLVPSGYVSNAANIAVAGTRATFIISVTDTGPSDAQLVQLTETIPTLPGAKFLSLASFTSPAGWTTLGSSATTITLQTTALTASTTPTKFTLVEAIDPSVNDFGPSAGPTLPSTNTFYGNGIATSVSYGATVSTTTTLSTTQNFADLASTLSITIASVADLVLSVTARSDVALAPQTVFLQGDRLVFVTIDVFNAGPSDARNFELLVGTGTPITFVNSLPSLDFAGQGVSFPTSGSTLLVLNGNPIGQVFQGFIVEPNSPTTPTAYPAGRLEQISFSVLVDVNTASTLLKIPVTAFQRFLPFDSDHGALPQSTLTGTAQVAISPGKPPIFVIPPLLLVVEPVVQVATALPGGIVLLVSEPAPVPLTISTPLVLQQLSRSNQTGEIVGWVFSDLNANGVWDDEEKPEEGVIVYLDLDNSGVYDESKPHTTTNAQGEFRFPNLTAGSYPVRIALGNLDQQTFPDPMKGNGAHSVVVSGAVTFGTTKDIRFGVRRRAIRKPVVPTSRVPDESSVAPMSLAPVLAPPLPDLPPEGPVFLPSSVDVDRGRAAVFQRFDEWLAPSAPEAWSGLGAGLGSDDGGSTAPLPAAGAHAQPGDGWVTRIALAGMLAGALVMVDDQREKPRLPSSERPSTMQE